MKGDLFLALALALIILRQIEGSVCVALNSDEEQQDIIRFSKIEVKD